MIPRTLRLIDNQIHWSSVDTEQSAEAWLEYFMLHSDADHLYEGDKMFFFLCDKHAFRMFLCDPHEFYVWLSVSSLNGDWQRISQGNVTEAIKAFVAMKMLGK